ncbi:MAG: deoxyribodipyrimidine photo-lyase, partial [Demequina sp.]|uniref:deoxyribodipyrimidine photo-lyase n=1 Tax=Demequina sp. TaxID=2050685 RepID=UPI003A84D2C7
MTSLWWARRDLRLADNPALVGAQEDGAAAVFAWTDGITRWSGRRSAHLARVLWQLRDASSGALAVRRGAADAVVTAAAQEADARVVWAAREYSPAGIAEQDAVAAALTAGGRELRLIGSPYAVA